MYKILSYRIFAAVALAFLSSAPLWGQASLTSSGFMENFDSMGQDGTSPPNGWNVYTISGSNTSWQPTMPLAVTGFNADVISDKDTSSRFAQPFDQSTSAWFEAGAVDDNGDTHNNGLSTAFVSATGTLSRFVLQPSTANVLQLKAGQTGTLTVTTPAAYPTLYVIATSGNGAATSVGSGTIHFADGSTQAFSYNVFDWCNGTTGGMHPEAVLKGGPIGRNADVGTDGTAFSYNQNCDFQIYETVIAVDSSHAGVAINSIDFTGASDAFFSNIFGVTVPQGVPADQVAGVNPLQTPSTGLIPEIDPMDRQNNGINGATSDAPDDRALTTSPTGVSGAVLELVLTNNAGRDLTSLNIAYDIRRFTAGVSTDDEGNGPGADELPGYWLFYSLDNGATYTNVSQVNPDIKSVPNTVGVTHMTTTITLSSTLTAGSSIVFRWVDDNGIASSPDQIIGLDNVSITSP
jgi:hypothetical protein